jgi:hypothetical protein
MARLTPPSAGSRFDTSAEFSLNAEPHWNRTTADSGNVFRQNQGSAYGAEQPIGIEAKHALNALESGGRTGTYFNRVGAAENFLVPSPMFFAVTFSPGLHS